MLTSFVWRNCLIKELNIPEVWKNLDCLDCDPPRQDLFLVIGNKEEAQTIIIPKVRNLGHLAKIASSIPHTWVHEFHFLVARDLSYIQYYPYMNLNTPGSLWEKFRETSFMDLAQLRHIELEVKQ